MSPLKISRSLCGLMLVSAFAIAPVSSENATPPAPAATVAEPVEVEKPFEKRMAKVIRRYELAVPDLSEEQKTKMLAIGEVVKAELDAIAADTTLTDAQKQQKRDAVYEGLYVRTDVVLTPSQLVKWKEAVEARRKASEARELNLRAGETLEQKQARILQPFVEALPDLTAEQKAKLLPIAEGASDVLDEVRADATRTDAQKAAIERRVNATTLTKISEVLTKKQFAQWNKAVEAKAKAAESKAKTEKK